jgi:serine/threonine protein kinase
MKKAAIIRKETLRKKMPEKKLSLIKIEESSSSLSDTSTNFYIQNDEAVSPNPVRKTSGLTVFSLAHARISLSPCVPFGPKTKACLVPFKNLSESVQTLEMDVLENYNIWSDIGRGSYATVKLATHKVSMQKCAIKIYSKKSLENASLKKNVSREIKILKKIHHPNIVEFYEEIEGKNNLYIAMEYVKGISLNNHLQAKASKKLEEMEACKIFSQLMSALDYCHSRNIAHRDIKLENVQLDLNFNLKLIDFGFATCYSTNKKTGMFCGSPSYMAPEIVNKEEFLGPPVDIWAAGVVLYILITGVFPFKSNHEDKVFLKIKKGKFSIPEWISSVCKSLIKAMLDPVPENRPSASEILNHSWISSRAGTSLYASPNSGDNIEVSEEDI